MLTKEELIMLVKKAHADRFIPADSKKEKVILNAIKSYASDCRREDVVAIFDRTITGNGKNGFLLARNALYGDNIGRFKEYTQGVRKIPFEGMIRFYCLDESKRDEPMAEAVRKSFFRFEYADGSEVLIYLSEAYSADVLQLLGAVLAYVSGEKDGEVAVQRTQSHIEKPEAKPLPPEEITCPEKHREMETEEILPATQSGQSSIEQQQAEVQRQIQQLMRQQEELSQRAEEEARWKAEEERKRAEEEARRKAEEERKRAEKEARRNAHDRWEQELSEVFDKGAAACMRKDYAASVPYFEKAALEYSYVPAMENLGYMYMKKEMLGEYPEMAEKWLKMAVEHGSKKAKGSLDLMKKQDMFKIRLSHRRDADMTRPLLANMSFNDAFVLWRKGQDALEDENSPKKAFQLVYDSLPGRLSQTRFTLGMMYRKGLGVTQDKAKAGELFGSLRKEDQVIFGRYPQTNDGMECEIAWKVLCVDQQKKRLLLFSEKVLDIHTFQPTLEKFDAIVNGAAPDKIYDSKEDQVLEMKTISVLSSEFQWKKSEIREWLNGLFIKKAFRPYEEEMLCETELETLYKEDELNRHFTTRDRVFLLSLEEFIKYIGDEGKSIIENNEDGHVIAYCSTREDRKDFGDATAYSELMETQAPGGSLSGGTAWWLRTPGNFPGTVMCGLKESLVLTTGNYTGWKRGGIRPAIWVTWK